MNDSVLSSSRKRGSICITLELRSPPLNLRGGRGELWIPDRVGNDGWVGELPARIGHLWPSKLTGRVESRYG